MKRRQFLTAGAAVTACTLAGSLSGKTALAASAAEADGWPAKPLRIVNPYPPGGIVDILARLIGNELSQSLGQPVVVEDRAGAGGNIGTAYVARAAGDPYTLLLGASGPLAINVSLYNNLGYDPVRDFTPISLLAATPLVLVTGAKSGINAIDQLMDHIKRADEPPFYGSAGVGTPQHLAMEMFKQKTGLKTAHVAYKGGAPAVVALMSGEVLFAFENLALVQPQIEAGQLKALAVSSPERSALLADVPTVAESGIEGFEARGWYGLLLPADMPAAVAQRLTQAVVKAAAQPKVREVIGSFGSENVSKGPEAFAQLIASEIVKWRGIIQAGNITLTG